MGQAIFVGDIVLKPYDPVPALVTPVTRVDRAKFPATDIHAHWPASLEPAALLKAMDDLGVERAVNLSGGFGAQLDRMLARYHDAAPGRLVIFGNIDFRRIDEPTFAADHVAMLERAHAAGMAGAQDLQEPRADHQGRERTRRAHRRPSARPDLGRVRTAAHSRADPLGRSRRVLRSHRREERALAAAQAPSRLELPRSRLPCARGRTRAARPRDRAASADHVHRGAPRRQR